MGALKHWHSYSEVIANWNHQWVKTDKWEKEGGRTLHWSITGYENISHLVPLL